MEKINKLEEIENLIEANKEILSTMPKNNPKNVKEYIEKIDEVQKDFSKYKDEIYKILSKRYQTSLSIEENTEIEDIKVRINTIKNILFLLSDEKNSYEKMELDKNIYKLSRYYKENLDNVNTQIQECIRDFDIVGIKLKIDDFDYSIYVTEYMETFLKEYYEGDINSPELKSKFEEIYWKCSDIIMHIELNLRYIYLKNQGIIDKYYEKEKLELLKKWQRSPEDIKRKYLELKEEADKILETDKRTVIDALISGNLNIKNYTDEKIKSNCMKIFPKNIIEETDNYTDIDINIRKFLNSLNEYKSYLEFKFIVNDIKNIYKEKEKYKKIYEETRKKIDTLEKKLRKLNSKSNKKGLFGKKTEPQTQTIEQTNLINEIREEYKNLDINEFYQKMYDTIDDNSSIYEVLNLACSYYNYMIQCLIKNNKNITQEEMDSKISELQDFVNSPYNTFINNITILEEKDISIIIKDRYKLLGFTIEKEDISPQSVDNLIGTLQDIKTGLNIKNIGINIEDINELINIKKTLKIK
ncbi:MAG: hypothetical protein IKF17_04915 [Clostridia bacterium]|nr:hypothetical protein [Clostridia bacterium]